MTKSTVIIGRLLKIERLSRELAELVADQANGADGREERQKRIDEMWTQIVLHANVVEQQSTLKLASTSADAS